METDASLLYQQLVSDELVNTPDAGTPLPPVLDESEPEFNKAVETVYAQEGAEVNPDGGFFGQVNTLSKYFKNKYDRGYHGFIGDMAMFSVMQNGGEGFEEALIEYDEARLKKEEKVVGDLRGKVFFPQFFNAAGLAVENLPMLMETTKAGVIAAPAGAAAGAATGAAAGAVAGMINPAPGPEDIATIGSGAVWGGVRGTGIAFTTGTGILSGEMMAGNMYKELRLAGVDNDVATKASYASGAIMGLIEAVQIKGLGAAGKASLKGALKTPGGKAAVRAFLKDYAKEVGWQAVEEELQELTAISTELLVNEIDSGANLDERLTWKNMGKRLWDAGSQGLQASAFLVGGSKAVGTAAGSTVSATKEGVKALAKSAKIKDIATKSAQITRESRQWAQAEAFKTKLGAEVMTRVANGKMSIVDTFKLIKEGLTNLQPDAQSVEEARQMGVSETVDMVQENLVDQDGKVIVNNETANLKATITQEVTEVDGEIVEVTGDEQLDSTGDADSMAVRDGSGSTDTNVPETLSEDSGQVEIDARREYVSGELDRVDTELETAEKERSEKDQANARLAEITQRNQDINARQKSVAAEIKKKQGERAQRVKDGKQVSDVDKSLSRLTAEQDALAKEQAGLQKERNKVKQKTGATTKLTAKIEKLQSERDNLATERDIIDDVVTEATGQKPNTANVQPLVDMVSKAKGKLTVGKITKLRAKAAKRAISKFKEGVKKGTAQAKAEMRQVRSEVGAFIRQADIPAADKNKLLANFGKVQTLEQMVKVLPEIERQIKATAERVDRADANARVNKALKRTALQKSSSKKPKGKYTADIQKVLDTYKQVVDKARKQEVDHNGNKMSGEEALADRAQELAMKRMAGQELTVNEAIEQDVINSVMGQFGFKSQDSRALNRIADEINTLIDEGKTKAGERHQQRMEQKAQNVAEAIESIQGDKPLSETALNQPLRKGAKGAVRQVAATLFHTWDAWAGKMNILSQHDPKRKLAEAADTFKAKMAEKKAIRQTVDEVLMPALQKAMGVKNKNQVLKKIQRMSQTHNMGTVVKAGEHVAANGKVEDLQLSRAEALDLWMKFQDPTLKESLKADYTFEEDVSGPAKSTEQVLNEYLSEEDKAVGEVLLQFYRDYYNKVNQFFREKAGTDLPFNENYSPLARINFESDAQNTLLEETRLRFGLMPAAAISRVDNTHRIQPDNAFSVVQRHILHWEHAIAWDPTITKLNDMFHNPQVKNLIENKYGKNVMQSVHKHLENFITNRAYVLDQAFTWADHIRRATITASLGLKTVSQATKQMTSMFAYLDDVSTVDYVRGLLEVINDPVGVFDTLSKSEYMQARGVTSDRDINEMTRAGQFSVLGEYTGYAKLINALMIGTKVGDRGAIYNGGWSVYSAELRRTGDKAKAMEAFERTTDDAQQSGDIDQMADVQRVDSMKRLFTTYLTTFFQYYRKSVQAIRDMSQDLARVQPLAPDAESQRTAILARGMKTVLIYHFILPAFFEYVSNGFEMEDDDWARTAILGNFNSAFILGDFVEQHFTTAWNAVTGDKKKSYPPSDLLTDSLVDLSGIKIPKALGKAAETMNDEDIFKAIKEVSATASMATRLPLETGTDKLEDLAKWGGGDLSNEALLFSLAGWPRSVVDKKNANRDNKETEN